MKAAVAIITYNRLPALKKCFEGFIKLPAHNLAVFEDCGQKDTTRSWLKISPAGIDRPDLEATEYAINQDGRKLQTFLSHDNLGVAGISNKAIKWFMEETDATHLFLLNDDLTIGGDFTKPYMQAHVDTGVGLFCFCDFTSKQYEWKTAYYKGHKLKFLTRMTGIMMSISRELVKRIGYYDTRFGRYGEEHSDYTIRARLTGHISVNKEPKYCLDVELPPGLLAHQEIPSTVTPDEKPALDGHAYATITDKSTRYIYSDPYLPYALRRSTYCDAGHGMGLKTPTLEPYYVGILPKRFPTECPPSLPLVESTESSSCQPHEMCTQVGATQ